ncbi:MAG: phosphatase PAP2 family protein [Thermoanaerobaculia bacterium]|nr:phosphatase PAP2 family protein [Thermoanaerobaculia bacterium]
MRSFILIALLATSALSTVSCASARHLGRLAVEDMKAIPRSMRTADASDWRQAALVTSAVLASAALDGRTQKLALANDSHLLDETTEIVEPLGGRYSERVLAGFLVTGLLGRNEKAKGVAFDGFVASLIASKLITPALKEIVGRTRPNATDETFAFDGGTSFPSGHATQAFAVASVIAAHYDQRWVDIAAYGLAGAVACSRVYHDAHFLSDTVAGAVIGTAVGRLIVRTNNDARARFNLVPVSDGKRRGVVVSAQF